MRWPTWDCTDLLQTTKSLAVAIRNPHAMYPLFYPRRGTFCQQRKKVLKERRQNQGFGILLRIECVPCGKAFATRTERAGLPPCFRIAPAPPSAGRSRGPALAWRGRGDFCVYRGAYKSLPRTRRGRCLHRPAHCTPCKKLCHCEPVTDVTGVAIRIFLTPHRL